MRDRTLWRHPANLDRSTASATAARRHHDRGRNRVSARLPRRVQPGGHRAARQGRRRSTARARTRSPTATSARRSGSSASASTDPIACCYPAVRSGRKGSRAVQARRPGTRRSSSSPIADASSAKAEARRGIDPALFVRRLERPADPGQPRRAAVAPVRHVAPGADGLRGADRRGQPGALRQDAVGHLPGLSGGAADHSVGREPVGLRHPSHSVRPRGAEARREAGRDRSAHHARWRARPTCISRSGPAPTSRSRWRSTAICSRTASPTTRSCASTRPAPTRCASAPSRGRFERAAEVAGVDAVGARAVARALRRELARADPLRLGTRAQPQRRQRRDGGPGAAGGRRQVRRARRRLLDEQLGVVEHRPHVDRRARAGHAHRQHEPPRTGAAPSTTIRRSRCCSSTTAIRRRPCRISGASSAGSSARICSPSSSSR